MRTRLNGYKKVTSSDARRLDGRTIVTGHCLSKSKMMVVTEFDGIEFKQTGQFKASNHPERKFAKKFNKLVQP